MKKFAFLAAAAVLLLSALGGCAFNAKVAADAQAQVAKACSIVQPTLVSLQAMNVADPVQQAILKTLVTDNGAVCATAAGIDTVSAKDLINTAIPAVLQLTALLPLDPAAKGGIQTGLLVFRVALSAALTQAGTPTAVPVPAATVSPVTPPAMPTAPIAAPAAAAVATQ